MTIIIPSREQIADFMSDIYIYIPTPKDGKLRFIGLDF